MVLAKRAKEEEPSGMKGEDAEIKGLEAQLQDFDEMAEECEDVEGPELEGIDPKLLKAARQEEIVFMEALGMWEESSYEECLIRIGKGPVSTRWVDVDKGWGEENDIRSR